MTIEHDPEFKDVEVVKSVKTKGIQSHVRHINENGNDNVTLGHVLFLDFENTTLEDVLELLGDRFGTYFLFESSEGNYHVINPVIRSLVKTKELMTSIELQDKEHTDIGLSKGQWTLRATEKGHKDKPKLVTYRYEPNYTDIYSRPHLEYIAEWHNVNINIDKSSPVGDTLKIVEYFTRPNNH